LSCQKKQEVVHKDSSENQNRIVKYYNETVQKDKTTSDTLPITPQKLEELSQKEPKEFQAMVAIVLGLQNSNKGLYQLGIKNYENAMSFLQTSTVDSLKAKALNGIGNNYKNSGDYPKAFKNLYASLALYEKNNDAIGIGSVHNRLGDVYFQMGQPEKAKAHFLTGMKVLENQKSSLVYLSAAHSLANYYGMTGDFDSAMKIDEMGIRVSDSINAPKMKVSFFDNKANCFLFTNRMDSAYFYFNECLKLDLIIGNKKQIADTYSNLGQYFMMNRNYPEAEKQVEKSIALLKSMDAKPNLGKSYAILSEIYTTQNRYEKAFGVQKQQMANNKLMIEEKQAASLSEYQIIYETQKKESTIRFLELENNVGDLTIQKQRLKIKRTNYLILVFGLLMTVFLVVAYFWRNQQKLKNLLEREKAIKETEEAERIRMAKDIHDDLGSGLSKINFLSEIISQKAKEFPEIKNSTESIKETAKKMIDNMRDLIWALNPDNATLANLVARMREHTTDYMEDYAIDIEYSIPKTIPQTLIKNEINRGLFLVVKEAINNISKHSKATKIRFKITISDEDLTLTIKDNGIGYQTQDSNGNGLKNMHSRIEDIGGTLSVNSKLDAGTEVKIEIQLATILKK
jgi:signal transduction histidine kinase